MRAYCVSTARVSIIFFCSLSLLFPFIVFRGGGSIFDGLSIHLISQVNTKSIRRMGRIFFFLFLSRKKDVFLLQSWPNQKSLPFFFFLCGFFSRCHIVIYTSQLDGITCHPISGFCKRKCFLISVFALRVTHCRAEWSCEQSQLWPRPFEWKERDVKVMSIHLQFEIRRDGMELWRWKEEEDLGFKGFFVYMYSLMDFSSFFSSFFLLLLLLLF